MTDRITMDPFERRLADAFRRVDLPSAPAGLRDALEQVVDLPIEGAGRGVRRTGRGGVFGVLGIAAVLFVGGALAVSIGSRPPAGPQATDDARGSTQPTVVLTYEVAWTTEVPSSAAALADIVRIVQTRLDAGSGAGTVVTADGPNRLQVHLPPGLDLGRLRSLVGQTGLVAFVPLGTTEVAIGDRVDPAQFPALFGGEAVTSATRATGPSGEPTLEFQLEPAAGTAFGDYTASHVGDSFAITVDGIVLSAPRISSEIPSGAVVIDFPADHADDDRSLLLAWLTTEPLPVGLTEIGGGLQPSAAPSPPAPLPTDVAVASPSPAIVCEPPLDVQGEQLGCEEAVQSAFTVLPAGHPQIATITFVHDCNDTSVVVNDCLVQMFGVVTFTFVDGSPPIRVALSRGTSPRIIADPFAS